MCVLIHIRIKRKVSTMKPISSPPVLFLLTIPKRCFLCRYFCDAILCFLQPCGYLLERADLLAFLYVMFSGVSVTLTFGGLGQGWFLILSVTSHINCIVARCLINVVYLTACCLYQVMMTLHFLNDVANDAESTYKSKITS